MQVMFSIRMGQFQDLTAEHNGCITSIACMEELCTALSQAPLAYEWISKEAMLAMVQLLAATILRPIGKIKQAMVHIARGGQLCNKHRLAYCTRTQIECGEPFPLLFCKLKHGAVCAHKAVGGLPQ